MHGNMRLIVELFKLDLVSGDIIRDCLVNLLQELNNPNIEVLCNMLDTLTDFQVERAREVRLTEAKG